MKEQPEEEAFQRASEEASKLARSLFGTINTMALLASPRIAVRMTQWPSREEMLEQMETYLRFVDRGRIGASGMNLDAVNSEPHALKLRELFRTWTPSAPVPADIMQAGVRIQRSTPAPP